MGHPDRRNGLPSRTFKVYCPQIWQRVMIFKFWKFIGPYHPVEFLMCLSLYVLMIGHEGEEERKEGQRLHEGSRAFQRLGNDIALTVSTPAEQYARMRKAQTKGHTLTAIGNGSRVSSYFLTQPRCPSNIIFWPCYEIDHGRSHRWLREDFMLYYYL